MRPPLVPSCVWLISDEVITACAEHLGDVTDAYVNGSQTWLVDEGPGGITVEWRLHPVASYRRPSRTVTEQVLPDVIEALSSARVPDPSPAALWDGLEAFPAYDDEAHPEPAELRAWCVELLGLAPDHHGLVDHAVIASEWERTERSISIVDRLVDQLTAT